MKGFKPVFAAWPPKKRAIGFPSFAAGIFLVSFLVIALATQSFFLALLLPPLLAVGGAYALVGLPEVKRKDGKPLIEPQYKPYLFFVLAPLFALLLYPILGIALTQAGLPLKILAITCIVLAIGISIPAAYFLVGVPNLAAAARKQYEQLPPERRPFLFFPLTVVFFLVLYVTLGVVTTQLMGRVSGDPTGLLNIQVLLLTPICLALAGLLAWLLVGVPPMLTKPAHHLPKVTGKHRPRLFLATTLVVGAILVLVVGAILTYLSPLPESLVLPLAVILGFAVGFGIAALAWGTPRRWRRYDDYRPGLPPKARTPLLVALSVLAGLAVAVGIGLANIDLFWGILAGGFVAAIVAVFLFGIHRKILARRSESTLVPDLPDGLKPLILFPTWFLVSLVLFAVLTYAVPRLISINALVSVLVGLVLTFFLLEQPLLKEMREERARERQKRKDWEARRKARLAEAEAAGKPPEA